MLQGNWVDLVIILVLVGFVWDGWRKGIFWLMVQLVAFAGSWWLALRFYAGVAEWLTNNFELSLGVARAIGFVLVAMIVEQVMYEFLGRGLRYLPKKWFPKWWQGFMSVVPSMLSGLVVVAVLLSAIAALPIKTKVKQDILASKIGGYLLEKTKGLELPFVTVPVGSEERVELGFKLKEAGYRVDEAAEAELFKLVNEERERQGVKRLEWWPEAVEVARGHSRDMVERGYFAHTSPEGKDAGDRLAKAGLGFELAGENLALAPTVSLVHQGLMASPGHRANIIESGFGRVAIGVIDSGVYGKMVTQIYAN